MKYGDSDGEEVNSDLGCLDCDESDEARFKPSSQ